MDENKIGWFGKFYSLLAYLVALTFIILGSGILLKILLPEPFPLSLTQRWVLGGIILAYGIARVISIYVKSKKKKEEAATINNGS